MKKYLFLFFLIFLYIAKSQTCPSIKDAIGNENINIDCAYPLNPSHCLPLKITFNDLKNTDSYILKAITYPTNLNFNSLNTLDYKDNEYLKRIDFSDTTIFGNIPFSFSFYGETENSVIVSSNGYVSFSDLYNEGDFSTKEITGRRIPSTYLPPKSIFGVYQDLDFTYKVNNIYSGNVNYRVEGNAPCRKLIISFFSGNIYGTNQFSTSQIILYENSNNIDVYVENKPLPNATAPMREALIGIIDADGNGISPTTPDRNTGVWSATKEAYRFSPSGSVVKPSKIVWNGSSSQTFPVTYNNNTSNITLCSKSNETITATAFYNLNDGEIITLTDEINITFDKLYPLSKDFIKILCNSTSVNYFQKDINPDILVDKSTVNSFVFKYYLDFNDANTGASNFLNPNLPLDITQKYFVRIESAKNPNCFRTAEFSFLLLENLLLKNSVDICDKSNDGIEKNFQLDRLTCQLFPPEAIGTKKYFVNGTTTPVTTANLTNSSTIYVKYTYGTCTEKTFGPINVNFTSGPDFIKTPISFSTENEICDIITNTNPIFSEPFDWQTELKNRSVILTNDPNVTKITVFEKQSDAENININNSLKVIKEGNPNLNYTYTLYARLEYPLSDPCKGICFSVVPFTAKVIFNRIILNIADGDTDVIKDEPTKYDIEDADIYLCERNQSENVNIQNDAVSIINLMAPTSGITVTFHTSFPSANNPLDNGITNFNQVIPDDLVIKTYYVRYKLGDNCFVVKKLVYHILDPIAEKKFIDICTSTGQTLINVILSNYDKLILGSQWSQTPRPTVTYYDDFNLTKPITNLDVTKNPYTVWAVINSSLAGSCAKKQPIQFIISEIEGIKTDKLIVNLNCDNFNDNQETILLTDFYAQLVSGNFADYNFQWYKNYYPVSGVFNSLINDPSIPIKLTKSTTFYLRLSIPGTSCFRKIELQFVVDFTALAQLKLNTNTKLLNCNNVGVQMMKFDLRDAIPRIYEGNGNPTFNDYIQKVQFFTNKTDAYSITSTNFLSDADVQNYLVPSTIPVTVMYARFVTVNGCNFVGEFILRIIDRIKFNVINDIEVCDENFDGKYQINLREWATKLNTDADPNNDLVTDPDVAEFANFTFYDNGVLLSPTEETNYTINNTTQIITIKADINGNCGEFTTAKFVLKPYNINNFSIDNICDSNNDGKEEIDLTQFENATYKYEYYATKADLYAGSSAKIPNPDKYPFDKSLGISKFYGKVITTNSCPNLLEINVSLKETPIFTIDNLYVCPKEKYPLIEPDYKGYTLVSYDWRDAANNQVSPISSSSASNLPAGKYTLKVTSNNGCIHTASFEILEIEVPVITSVTAVGNVFTVIATGSKKIIYSTDLVNWQESNIFSNLSTGIVNFYVKYEGENCVGESFQNIVFDFPNSFTPNGDSINDVWRLIDPNIIKGDGDAVLKIYDKLGRLVYQQNEGVLSWDGTVSGRKVPSDTYWYYLELPDGRIFKGWILLKNKN